MKYLLLLFGIFLMSLTASADINKKAEANEKIISAKNISKKPNLSWYQNPHLLSLKARFMPGKNNYYDSLRKRN